MLYTGRSHQRRIRSDFDEITNLSVIHQLKNNLYSNKFCISTNHNRIATDESFIRKFVSRIYKFEVQQQSQPRHRITSNDVQRIKNVLSCSHIKVCFVAFEIEIIKNCCLTVKKNKC